MTDSMTWCNNDDCGTIRRTLRNARADTRIKFLKTMAVTTLWSGIWTFKMSDETAYNSQK